MFKIITRSVYKKPKTEKDLQFEALVIDEFKKKFGNDRISNYDSILEYGNINNEVRLFINNARDLFNVNWEIKQNFGDVTIDAKTYKELKDSRLALQKAQNAHATATGEAAKKYSDELKRIANERDTKLAAVKPLAKVFDLSVNNLKSAEQTQLVLMKQKATSKVEMEDYKDAVKTAILKRKQELLALAKERELTDEDFNPKVTS